jgi:hypothetical protein
MTEPLIHGLTAKAHGRIGREIIRFNNRLAETGLFEDAALARLLDAHPRASLDICTMASPPPPDRRWVAGEANGLDGAQLVEAVKTGRLWLNLRRAMNQHDDYRAVFDRLMAEFAQETGVKVLDASGGILISAPRLGVFYHCDSTDTMLWHVRGEKTIYVYPEEEAFLPEQAYEGVVLKENLSDIPYSPELEASATPVHLRPGESVSWPLHGPHRVVNHDSFNVSVTIEFKTPRSTFTNGTYYTNGVLRRRFGMKPKTRAVPEMLKPAYWAASKALRPLAPKTDALKSHGRGFDVRLEAPHCIAWRDGWSVDGRAEA